MKIKTITLSGVMVLAILFSCQKDPQKRAERIANTEETKSENYAAEADKNLDKSTEHLDQSAEHSAMEDINRSIAAVTVPDLSTMGAKELARKIGNHAIDYVNSKNYQESGKYVDEIRKNLQELDSKTANGSISADDSKKIRDYAISLVKAIGGTL